MALNPMALMRLKGRFEIFRREHPRVLPFLKTVKENALREGTVMELKFTTEDGKEYVSNIRLTPDDIETLSNFMR